MSEPWNPRDDPALTAERQAQIRRVVLSGIAIEPSSRVRHPVAIIVGGIIGSVLVATGTAAALVAITTPDEGNLGYCSSAVTTDPAVWEQNAFGSVSSPAGKQQAFDSIEACTAMWKAGIVRPPSSSSSQSFAVPPLSACVVDGRLVVYPEADACKQLGVSELAP